MMVALPPDSERTDLVDAPPRQGFDRRGFHATWTIDYLYVVEGELEMVLDTGSVRLVSGDCLVQQGTHHALRNPGHTSVLLLAVLTSIP
jgi:mannose-6-phosphate isomerase-like protein (cupin superfamily)